MKELPLDGVYEGMILAGESPDSYNDIDHPNRVVPVRTTLGFAQGVLKLPPHSLTIVKVPLK